MNFDHVISNNTGLVHLVFSVLALISGTLVLILQKGSDRHKKVGYLYSISMLIVLITAFMLYNLFGKWGIFHWTAVISTITLLCGLIPVFTKKPKGAYIPLHFSFMYWSVIGLYGAFVSETFVRLPKMVIENGAPNSVFYNMMGIGIALTMGLGAFFFIRNKAKWEEQFKPKS